MLEEFPIIKLQLYQMSVTLKEIWSAPVEELQAVLFSQGRDLTGNIGYDRATVALIYYNMGVLKDTPARMELVTYPRFVEVMANTSDFSSPLESLTTGLQELRNSLTRILLLFWHYTGMLSPAYAFEGRAMVQLLMTPSYLRDIIDRETQSCIYRATFPLTNTIPIAQRHDEDAYDTNVIVIAVREARRNAERRPGATPQSIERAVITAAWYTVLGFDSQIKAIIDAVPLVGIKQIKPIPFMQRVLGYDMISLPPIVRCFWLYVMSELLQNMPPNEELTAKFNDLVVTYGCSDVFAEVPIVITEGLSPILGQMGRVGGQADLTTLIAEYASRQPTREEVIARIRALA